MPRGRLVVFEGAEGAGKSTQVRRLATALGDAGTPPVVVREPGGTGVGEAIREILLSPDGDLVPRAETLLFLASRAELVRRVIEPALDAGRMVIADRFFLSTYAYQIVGRGLPEAEVRAANAFATGALVPDLTLLLSVPSAVGLSRAAARGGPDRIERAGDEFHRRVEQAFAAFADAAWQDAHPECGPIVTVDAAGGEDEVFARVRIALRSRWPETSL